MRFRLLGATALAAALILVPSAAHAAGSDSPTPYTVTAQTLTLPAGTTFEANGHINYRVTQLDGTGEKSFNVHESVPHNGQWPQARYVGTSVYTWTDHPSFAASFPDGYCITWVQVSLYNEHFGEGGQAPVCTTTPVVDPDPTTPVVDPTDPVVDPTDPVVDPTDLGRRPDGPGCRPDGPGCRPDRPRRRPDGPVVDPTDPTVYPSTRRIRLSTRPTRSTRRTPQSSTRRPRRTPSWTRAMSRLR